MGKAESLREEAIAKIYEAKSIYATAESSGREPTAEEEARVDALMKQAERLSGQSEALHLAGDSSQPAWLRDMLGRAAPMAGAGGTGRSGATQASSGPRRINGVTFLRPTDRFADAVHAGPEDSKYSGLTMGDMVRSLITGEDLGVGAFQAVASVGNSAAGGVLVPTPLSGDIIDLARNQARCIQAGAQTIPMTATTLTIPRVTQDATGEWKAENAAVAAIQDVNLEPVVLSARTVIALAKMSGELFEDSPAASSLINDTLAAVIANAMDLACLRGAVAVPPAGQTNPIGVRYATGVDVTPIGATLANFDPFSAAVDAIHADNGEPNAIIWAPDVAGYVDRLKDSTYQPLQPPESYRRLGKFPTNQAAAGEAYVGDWSQMLIGMRTNIAIEATRVASDSEGSAWRNFQVWVRAYARLDMVLARPAWFQVLTGIAPLPPAGE